VNNLLKKIFIIL